MTKVVIEVKNGKVIGVFGNEPLEVSVYADIDTSKLSDEALDELDEITASVPYAYEPDEIHV